MAGFTTRDLRQDAALQEAPAPSAATTIAAHLEIARRELHEAAGEAMRDDDLELYVWLSGMVGKVDGKRAALAARKGGR